MDRKAFEQLRDLPGKKIRKDIRLSRKRDLLPNLTADNITIENDLGVEVVMNINYNEEVGSKTINVVLKGRGPICRLDVDGPAHRPAGRSHKHSLQTPRCPDRNLPDKVLDRPDLAGKPLHELFTIFCEMAHIEHEGTFESPDLLVGSGP
ncbi:hypothetical protein [Cystobacter fuscus]|uniref:hypothetical protein n=1 Tax=Cystobacter fuscus TaxID=43 RepID=UPI002B2EF0B7|nr:hypothetical protein F0U63_00175 [Cystobacter fuscus]